MPANSPGFHGSFSSNLLAVADSREGPPGARPPLIVNLVPRVLSYPPYGALLSLSCSVGHVGENPGNEVALLLDQIVRPGPSLI